MDQIQLAADDAAAELIALRALVGELVEGLAGVVPLIEHHDFSNGVEHNGMDQGDVFARNILGEVQSLIAKAKAKEQVK